MIFISEVKKTKTLSLFSIPQKRKIVHRKLTALRELFVSGKKNSQFHVPPDRKKKQKKNKSKVRQTVIFWATKKKLSRSLHLKPTLVCGFLTRKKKVEGLHFNAYKFHSKKKKECEKQSEWWKVILGEKIFEIL